MARRQSLNLTQVIGTTGTSLATSATVTGSGNSQEFYEFATADRCVVYLEVSAISGAAPSFTVKLQERNPATGNWVDVPSAAFATQAATTGTTPVRLAVDPNLAACCRAVWTFAGTTTSVTFSLVAVLTSASN